MIGWRVTGSEPGWGLIARPGIYCDVCGRQITPDALGHVLFQFPSATTPEFGLIRFVHKGPCDRSIQLDESADKETPGWEEMDFFLEMLVNETLGEKSKRLRDEMKAGL